MKAGFIGLGNIGKQIAEHIVRSTRHLTVFDLAAEPLRELQALGATVASSAGEVAKASDIIGICVRDDNDVRNVMYGQDGVLAHGKQGLLVMLHSTLKLETVREVAEAAAQSGIRVVDAPVSRGIVQEGRGIFIFMLGGEQGDVARARAFVEPAACRIVEAGPLGSGMVLKLCNNNLTYLGVVALADALRLSIAAGADPAALAQVVSANGVGGANLIEGLAHREAVASGDRNGHHIPSLDSLVGLALKDLDNALALALEAHITLPSVEMTRSEIERSFRGE